MKRFSVLPALLLGCVVALTVGCGGEKTKKKDDDSEMSKPLKELIVGTWELQMEVDEAKLDAALEKPRKDGKKIPDGFKKMQKELMMKMLPKTTMTIEINEDGTANSIVSTPNPLDPDGKAKSKTTPSKWELVSSEGKTGVLKITQEGESREAKITFVDEDTIRIDDEKIKEAPLKDYILKRKK